MIKPAIFDFDGTLADTIPLCREAFRRAIRKLDGRILTDEEIERQFGPDDLGVIQKLIPGKPELHERGRELFTITASCTQTWLPPPSPEQPNC